MLEEPVMFLYSEHLHYLNGDMITGDMVSATQGVSLQGAVNLQFASSATLTPMEYTFRSNT